jgi:hypothetical protein
MNKSVFLVLLLMVVLGITSGCGGSGSSGKSESYAGEWQGVWAIPDLMSTGREIIAIHDNGEISGYLYIPNEAELADVTGSINQDGVFSIAYQFQGAEKVTLNGVFKKKNGVLAGAAKYLYDGNQYDMAFTLAARTDNQYAGVWSGNWTAGANIGFGECTIRINGLIDGAINYSEIGMVYINGISDNTGFSFSFEYGSKVYSVVGAYSSLSNDHLTGTFVDAYLGNGTFDMVKQ